MINPDWTRFRSIECTDVYKGSQLAATLTRSNEGVSFEYTSEYLDRSGPPVATTLPLTQQPVLTTGGAVPAFFAGLLPEGRRLSGLYRAIKTSADDEFSLLVAVGADPVGDVRIVPKGAAVTKVTPLIEVHRSWSEVSFSEILGNAAVIDPQAIAGVQDKASARMLSIPIAKSGQSFILKIDLPEFPQVVRNENYFLSLVRKSNFPVTQAQIVYDRGERPGLLVTRFDRYFDSETKTVKSHAVEDATQILSLYPADKYRITSEQLVRSLAKLCSAGPVALRDLYAQFVLAWLTGNGDLHGKNVSLLQSTSREWKVSPIYDIPSTVPYGDRTMALPVGGKTTGFSRKSLLAFAAEISLPAQAAQQILDRCLDATQGIFTDRGSHNLSPFSGEQNADTLRVLKHRRRALHKQ